MGGFLPLPVPRLEVFIHDNQTQLALGRIEAKQNQIVADLDSLNTVVGQLITLIKEGFDSVLARVQALEEKMIAELAGLKTEVEETQGVVASAIVLLNGVVALLEDLKTKVVDPESIAAITDMQTKLHKSKADLADAVAANQGEIPPKQMITSVSPASGPVGAAVSIMGAAFTGTTDVQFGGVSAPGFTVVDDANINVAVPLGAMTGRVSVVTPSGTAVSPSDFTVEV